MAKETKWYVLHTYSGFEAKVKQNIEHRAVIEGFKDVLKLYKMKYGKNLRIVLEN